MKYLIVLAVVMAIVWFVRNNRRADEPGKEQPRPGTLEPPQDMVQCAVCSLHLPRTEALPGREGRLYCCAKHRVHAGD